MVSLKCRSEFTFAICNKVYFYLFPYQFCPVQNYPVCTLTMTAAQRQTQLRESNIFNTEEMLKRRLLQRSISYAYQGFNSLFQAFNYLIVAQRGKQCARKKKGAVRESFLSPRFFFSFFVNAWKRLEVLLCEILRKVPACAHHTAKHLF